MIVDTNSLIKEVIQCIERMDKNEIAKLEDGELHFKDNALSVRLANNHCKINSSGVEITITDADAMAQLHKTVGAHFGGSNPFQPAPKELKTRLAQQRLLDESGIPENFRLDSSDLPFIPGLVRVDNTSQEKLQEITNSLMKPSYSHEEIYGKYCFLGEHINVPYDVAFEYAANVHSLPEWTLSLRNLRHIGGGLYRGTEAIESSDPNKPNSEIFIKVESMKGPDHGLILYPCAWDQGHELWMRYYFVFIDSQKTLNKPGTVVLWTNCKHPYYDRSYTNVPNFIEEGRARTDRQWVGDLWLAFYPLHYLEMNNLKSILEYRYQARSTMP
jgi:hypothetical protein